MAAILSRPQCVNLAVSSTASARGTRHLGANARMWWYLVISWLWYTLLLSCLLSLPTLLHTVFQLTSYSCVLFQECFNGRNHMSHPPCTSYTNWFNREHLHGLVLFTFAWCVHDLYHYRYFSYHSLDCCQTEFEAAWGTHPDRQAITKFPLALVSRQALVSLTAMPHQALCIISSPYVISNWRDGLQTAKLGLTPVNLTFDLWPWPWHWIKPESPLNHKAYKSDDFVSKKEEQVPHHGSRLGRKNALITKSSYDRISSLSHQMKGNTD